MPQDKKAASLLKFKEVSEDSLIVYAGETINRKTNQLVHFIADKLNQRKFITDVTPAYASLLISYNFLKTNAGDIRNEVIKIAAGRQSTTQLPGKTVKIPVFYGGETGPDLITAAKKLRLSIPELIHIHSKTGYYVYAFGFLPGFAYLGDVDERLVLPRRAEPRPKIAAGSVGIAGRQTAIYPVDSPGGWNIIGMVPLKVFNKEHRPPFSAGDTVVFQPVSKKELLKMGAAT